MCVWAFYRIAIISCMNIAFFPRDASNKKQKKRKKQKAPTPYQQRQSKKPFGANNFTGWHMCLSSLTQRGHLDIGTKKMGYHCIPTLLTLNLILWKTRCKDTAFSEKCKPSHHKNTYMQESLTTSHNLLHTSLHHVQFYRGFASLHAVRHNLQIATQN